MPAQHSGDPLALERAVIRIMASVLTADGLTGADSFYDLGGTSLHAVRICSRLRRELGILIDPQVLFDHDTVDAFCASVIAAWRGSPGASAPPAAGTVRRPRAAEESSPPAVRTAAEALDPGLIHEAVTYQALMRPDAVALVCGTERVSYRRLDALADACAHELIGLGVRPGHVVPVVLPRSRNLVVVLLAILKCGAAYAALDHRWPSERIAAVTGALDTPVVVTRTPGPRSWDPDAFRPDEVSTGGVRADVPRTAPAAVFFTSGTTGTPKGVVSPHRATTRLFAPDGLSGFGPGRVMPQAAPPSWDAFSLELWGMLTTGGTSVIVESDYLLPDGLLDLVKNEGVDTLWLTASLFNLFVDENVDCFSGLTQVLTGGERLSAAHAHAFLSAHPGVALVNGYGPVESCVFVTTHTVTARDCGRPGGVPVGSPVSGTTVHVLDGDTPLESGAEGEICVAGAGLAEGYLGDEQATAACFVTLAIDGRPTRLYRTGDRGTLDEDGVLHFLGRADRQVKIAGHRVEPAETETAARRLPAVRDCAVIPVPERDGGGYTHLALFYTADGPEGDSGPQTVRASLEAVLPRYLVPTGVHRRPSLPRTLNGKLDHAALLADLTAAAPGTDDERGVDEASSCLPMSYEQESIWINDQIQEGTSRYVEAWVNRLRGPVDVGAVQSALNGIVARHESLRSRLLLVEGRPVQQVVPQAPVPLAIRHVVEAGLNTALREAVSEPVVLSDPPLLKATLLRVAQDDAVLAVRVHHAVIDGWCFSLFDHEFGELYRMALGEVRPPLPGLPLQFGPYAVAQREEGEGARAQALAFWKHSLAGAPEESAFPTDRPRPAVLGSGGDRIEFTVGAALGQGIRRLSRRLRTTPFSVMAAALAVLIGRHTGQDDVVIGTPVSRRDTPEVAGMIACLTDVMPLRLRPAAQVPFHELVDSAKESIWSAVRHKDLPYSHLVRELGVERTLGRFPLFQVVFALDDAPAPHLDLPGVDAERLYVHSGSAKYDSFLHMIPTGDGYRGLWEFSTDLFDTATVHRFAARLRSLLEDVVADPGRPVWDLDILPQEERDQLTHWAQDCRTVGAVGAVGAAEAAVPAHEAFRRRARQQPRASAVRWRGQDLSYGELNRRSDAVAAHLVDLGLERTPVAICVERSPDLPVAVLGVLKAGCAYVPIDPAYPADRISFMVEDSGVRTVLTQRALADRAALPAGVGRCFLDDVPDTERVVRTAVTADDLACLIYTSGSTGRPKGVAMPHGPLANLLDWQSRRSTAAAGSRTLQFTSLSFDVAFQELFSTWSTGGTLVLVDDETRKDPERLLDLIEAERVQRLFLPFVALQQLVEHACATDRRCPSLTEIVTAGEQLQTTPALRRFFSALCTATLDNQYGPSETHVVTAGMLTGDPYAWPELPSIGRPVGAARIRLLDGRLRPVPVGAVGELCVAGPVMARGYVGRPELTGEKFVRTTEGRLYRTGDLARFLPDGRIQWLGRGDDQVKIRGHRVETGEVEAALRTVPGVADAVVVAHDQGPGAGRRLIAYYLAGSDAPAADALASALRRGLPDYMVPARCILLDAFPLTSSGKVDRKALATRPPADPAGRAESPPRARAPPGRRVAPQRGRGGVREGVLWGAA
ncbi:amino acid adenylation domain-containing protein, partial [Streptomyces sp. NPDC127084]|uniref:amino acid adenylation domain-containing protein n=1 Tax=Streptomyces sp. NPDC127084 TaxID=3347133 RepID=UPI00364B240C